MITDSHCHLGSDRFSPEEHASLIARAAEAGVTRLVTLATSLENLELNLELASQFPEIHCCIGIHPCDVAEAPDDAVSRIEKHVGEPEVVALGETGLDYFHPAPDGWTLDSYHSRQRDFLRQHFQLAAKAGLNVVIHTRDKEGTQSFDDALTIYREFSHQVRAVFHCFIADLDHAQQVIDMGGLVSFTGIATFKNPGNCLAVATALPLGSFMLETDAPYLAPTPHRGKRNESAYTRLIAETIAEAKGIPLPELASAAENTANSFFRFS